MNRGSAHRIAPALAAALLLLAARSAQTQAGDPQKLAAAQSLFNQASADLDRKDYSAACPKLEEVVKLVPEGLGARIALGECYEGAGRLASAWTTYVQAEAAAGRAKQTARQKEARARADKIRPGLAHLTVAVPEAVRALPGLAIERDGVEVGQARWGVEEPVDKGKHVVVVTATGKQRWEKVVEVRADGVGETVTVEVPPDVAGPIATPPAAPTSSAAPRWPRGVAYGLGAASIGLFAVGGVMAILAKVKATDADAKVTAIGMATHDDPNACAGASPSKDCIALHDLRRSQGTFANAALWTFVASGAVAAGTLVYTFVGPRAAPAKKGIGLQVAPIAGPGGGGLVARGAF